MIDLDDKTAILQLQGGDQVLNSIASLDRQLKHAWEETLQINFPDEYKDVNQVVVCGMGGSCFPSLIIKELFKEQLEIPIVINNEYRFPGFVDNNTLVILSSYSGTTEEILYNADQAFEKKAKISAITTNGDLARLMKKNNLPYYLLDPIYNPSKQPRIGFGYAVGAILGILYNLKFLSIKKQEVEIGLSNLPTLLKNFSLETPKQKNPAKQLAEKLYQKYPYYTVAEFLTGVGNAIANQTNETAKSISVFRVIPELNHHLMEGLKFPKKIKDLLTFIFFYSPLYSEKIKKRFQITKEVVEKNQVDTQWVELKGKSRIEQTFELMGFGSYLTMYLSVLYEQNPSSIPFVDYFKKRLKD